MDKIPVACAMNWSIDFEKGIRSKGHSEEAIKQIGPRILSWSRELCVSLSASKIYNLIPGEEETFANTIFTRLVDTFLSGNDHARSSILKIFLLELKHIRNEGKKYSGILSKQRLPNYLEMLKRLLLVFNTGDVKARALSLRLLGCWAPLTHDNADVQNTIISSLRSDHVLEMKASLFACGCLSLLADDFVCVIISILVDILCTVTVSSDLKLAAARAFGEIQCSALLASKAYKSGQKLVQDACAEGYRSELLFSLTKLAIKSVILIPEQVKILLTVMVKEDSSVSKTMGLKCIRFLCSRGFSRVFVEEKVLAILMRHVNDPQIPTVIQCEVLKTLRQIFKDLSKICHEYSPDLQSLVVCIQDTSNSHCVSKRNMSLGLLVDISCNYSFRTEKLSLECVSSRSEENMEKSPDMFLMKCICLLLLGNIDSLINTPVTEIEDNIQDTKQNYRILSSYILQFVRRCPASGIMFLDRFNSLFKDKISQMGIEVDWSNPSLESQESVQNFSGTLFSCIFYFIIPCLNILNESGLIAPKVCEGFKLLLDSLQKVNFYGNHALEIVSFNLFLLMAWRSDDQWINHERFAHRLSRKMMSKEKYWLVYKVGKYSSTCGLWFSAIYIFKNLIPRAKSDSSHSWLKSLMLLAGAESEIKLLLFPKIGGELVNELFFDVDQESTDNYDGLGALMEEEREKLSRAHKRICSSKELILALRTPYGGLWFQCWFLKLREKGLEILLELLGHLLSGSHGEDFLLSRLTRISCQFYQLAREYDFMVVSFVDMDVKSSALISRLALYFSLLAYCSGFPLYSEGSSGLFLVEDLYGRLSDVDCKGVLDLEGHLPFSDWLEGCTDHSRRCTSRVGRSDADTLSVCRFAIYGIHRLLQDAKNGEGLGSLFGKVRGLLNDILVKWMGLPYNIPRYFFRLRDCMGAELFVVGDKALISKELSTFVGHQLCLHVCIRLMNIPPILHGRISKIHFILSVDLPRSTPKEENVEMHELLLLHMRKREKVKAGSTTAYACVGATTLGQGFSTCLLDVSAFPEGMYHISWHGCFVDDDHHLWSLPAFSNEIPFTIKRPFSTNTKAAGG